MKFSSVEFELFVANFYKNKVKNCQDRGIEFKLTLTSVRNMLRTHKCPYLGIELTVTGQINRPTDISIDRIDNTKGYVPGNVMACSRRANNLKSVFENPNTGVSIEQGVSVLNKMNKRLMKAKGEKK